MSGVKSDNFGRSESEHKERRSLTRKDTPDLAEELADGAKKASSLLPSSILPMVGERKTDNEKKHANHSLKKSDTLRDLNNPNSNVRW
jgi:hypothetical protein